MASRRGFIAGLLATGLAPAATWADAGAPSWLSAAGLPDGGFVLCGIGPDLNLRFRIALPGRGHAAAAHPTRPEAVAFARRPGTFAVVIDCAAGRQTAHLAAPEGRHFYGHGAFSLDGRWLYTTENDYDAARGVIGVWDAAHGYARAGEFGSGGIGPHEIRRTPGRETLVVANGGIETHPASGRTKLNIPLMRPNLSYIEDGTVVDSAALPGSMHKGSIRHIAVSALGEVAFGLQWQGGEDGPALVGLHRRGTPPRLCTASEADLRAMQGYVGSVAFTAGQRDVAVTSPRGGLVQTYSVADARHTASTSIRDACGVAPCRGGLLVASGTGALQRIGQEAARADHAALMWDNHLVAV
ncbi:DUF1513 domain-containing protein [Pelagivirga sediminicola]|uniref:DUF1513 domain-containing protein n=1 Tax=Pelagivirga sediminicola TaxID=2170575 RepID=A0A2T7G5M3_9RHOB|nr:DUF1513 domain-containing protein [Pelagivirga sediminicola]PVA09731.1 DUF1513 domain-containing protein [Pelagivirga sediminicola]